MTATLYRRPYFILVAKAADNRRFELLWGDYCLHNVVQERLDQMDGDHEGEYVKHRVMRTTDDQAAIDTIIGKLNS